MDRVTQALVEARKVAGLTQQQLADHLGIRQPTLAAIEKGRRPLLRERYARLPKTIRRRVIDAAIAELKTLR